MNITASMRSRIDTHILNPTSRAVVVALRWIVAHGDVVLGASTLGLAAAYFLYLLLVTHNFFWDFKAYLTAMKAMEMGVSPYNYAFIPNESGLVIPFIYPPIAAAAFYQLSSIVLTPAGLVVLLAIHVASWLAIPYLLADSPKRWYSREFMYMWGLYLVLFGFAGMRVLAIGNIACILSAAIVVSVIIAVRTQNYKLFWIALLLCSLIKFYLLSFLLIPVILDKKYAEAAGFLVLFAALFTLNYAYSPELFFEYIATAAKVSNNSDFAGVSLYSLVAMALQLFGLNDFRASLLALSVHFIFVIIIVMLAYAIAAKHLRSQRFDLFCCWLFLSAFLVSPRLLDYDVATFIVPLVLLGRMLLFARGAGLAVAIVIGVCGFTLIRIPFSPSVGTLAPWVGMFTILGVWLGAAVHWLTKERRTDPQSASRNAEPSATTS